MSLDFEKNVSIFIENQFPQFYKEEGELFITFMQAYYEWMESENQTLYHTRRLTDYRDIDKTVDDFIINFKNKYLSNIQFNIATNKQLFIKNALEFYRAKGSERAVDLFFKLVYGLEAKVYYPGDDLFKLSDNEWIDQRYLEIVPNPDNLKFVGQQVFGSQSGASAFCERLVRVKKDNQYIEVLYLTGVTSDFQSGEQVETKNLDVNMTARINGSLTTFEVTASDDGFEVGEEVYVSDGKGKKAKAVVRQIEDYVGVVEFSVLEGGWGYSDQAEIIGSERVFRFDNLTIENNQYFYHTDPVRQFELIQQDLAKLDLNTSNADLVADVYSIPITTKVFAYANNDPATNPTPEFEGTIVDINQTTGAVTINYIDENYRDANGGLTYQLFGNNINFYTSLDANGNGANVDVEIITDVVTNVKAQANIIAWDTNMTIEYTGNTSLIAGDILFQEEETAKQRFTYVSVANTFANAESGQTFANITRTIGCPRTNKELILSTNTDETFQIVNISNVFAGAVGWNGEIVSTPRFYDFANTYGANTRSFSTTNDSFTYSVAAVFQVSTISDQQSLTNWYSSELMSTELDVLISNTSSGITDFTTAINYVNEGNDVFFANTSIDDALTISAASLNIGSISAIVTTAPGSAYSRAPFFIIKEPAAEHLERYDFYIKYVLEEELKSFRIGEVVTTTTGNAQAKARITFHNPLTGEIKLTRLMLSARLDGDAHTYTSDDFRIGDRIIGEQSNVAAEIEVVDELRMFPRAGLNANILANAFNGTGFARALEVTNSGFGYFGKRRVNGVLVEGETLNLISVNNAEKSIQAYGYLGKQGIAPGSHPNRKSFLSADKYLQDNDYYQEYSYEVLTALPFDKYKQTLIEVLHVAGTRPFGSYVGTSSDTVNITTENSLATYNIKQYPLFINENVFYSANVA